MIIIICHLGSITASYRWKWTYIHDIRIVGINIWKNANHPSIKVNTVKRMATSCESKFKSMYHSLVWKQHFSLRWKSTLPSRLLKICTSKMGNVWTHRRRLLINAYYYFAQHDVYAPVYLNTWFPIWYSSADIPVSCKYFALNYNTGKGYTKSWTGTQN